MAAVGRNLSLIQESSWPCGCRGLMTSLPAGSDAAAAGNAGGGYLGTYKCGGKRAV